MYNGTFSLTGLVRRAAIILRTSHIPTLTPPPPPSPPMCMCVWVWIVEVARRLCVVVILYYNIIIIIIILYGPFVYVCKIVNRTYAGGKGK